MNINDMRESKYVKKSDVEGGVIVTIVGIDRANVAMENQPEEMKYLLLFKENIKPLVLNFTNLQLAAKACGSEDTDNWVGKQIVLWNDENVSFAGKLTGGVRIRKAEQQTGAAPTGPIDEDSMPAF